MSLTKRTRIWPATGWNLSDFFGNDPFFDSDLTQQDWWKRESVPAVNIKEHDNQFEIEVAAPGYEKDDFTLSIDNGVLHISGEHKEDASHENDKYTRREFAYHRFARSFYVPDHADEDTIKATYINGVLKLTLDKVEETHHTTAKQIEIS